MVPKESNSGVYFQARYEIQVYDSFGQKGAYPGIECGGIYQRWDPKRGRGKEGFEGRSPRANVSRPPGQWQSFDIIFFAPVFKSGKLEKPAYVTVLHNGVLVHHNQKNYGPTGHRILPRYVKPIAEKLPLSLSAHNNPVRFRNIWIRPL